METPRQTVAWSLRAVVCILLTGCSIYIGCHAVDQVRRFSGSFVPAVDLSLAVMLSAIFLTTADLDIRGFRFLCSGRFPVASRVWSRCITCLLFASFAAVLVPLFFLTP